MDTGMAMNGTPNRTIRQYNPPKRPRRSAPPAAIGQTGSTTALQDMCLLTPEGKRHQIRILPMAFPNTSNAQRSGSGPTGGQSATGQQL